MKQKLYKKVVTIVFFIIVVGMHFISHYNSSQSFKDNVYQYIELFFEKKNGSKDVQISNKSNKENSSSKQQTEYKPKGNKIEFCALNIYQNIAPEVNKGFNTKNKNELISLCYSGYAALFKQQYNISLWTAEKLSPEREERSKGGEREGTFYQDPTLLNLLGENKTVKTEDYIGASDGKNIRYDRGHLAPSRDMPLEDRYESFYMSNIVPQSANNNRNVWADIEKTSRCLAVQRKTDVYIVNVPVINISYYQQNNLPLPILRTKRGLTINIPDYMAKAIYIPKTGEIGVYLTKNDESKTNYQLISVNDLKKLSYIDVFPQISMDLKNKISSFPKPGQCK